MKKRNLLLISIFAGLVFGLYYFGLLQDITGLVYRPYPKLTGEKTITLTCNYHGKNLSVSENLYASLDNYYKTDPKKKIAYYANSNKDLIYNYKEDNTIPDLTDKIEKVGSENGLNSDQTLDLAACFLQSIPYDDAKAAKILGPNSNSYAFSEVMPRYPYETLYDNLGICTDKSYLGAAIFRQMGYETSLLRFDQDKHLSIGIGVPDGYQELGTSYAIMELTGKGFLVGDIPNLVNTGLAQNTIGNIPEISDNPIANTQDRKISNASGVENVSTGKKYTRIVERTTLRSQIENLQNQLSDEKAKVEAAKNLATQKESELQIAENSYTANPSPSSYNQYLKVYNSYKSAITAANNQVYNYNQLVKKYNSLVDEYKNY